MVTPSFLSMSKVSFVILCLLVGLGDGLRHTTGRMEFGVMRFLISCCLLALGHAARVRTHGFTKMFDRSVGSESYMEQASNINTTDADSKERLRSPLDADSKETGPKYMFNGRLIRTRLGSLKMLDPRSGKVADDALKCSNDTLHSSEAARVRAEATFQGLQDLHKLIPNLTSIVNEFMGFHFACDAAEYHGHWVYINNTGWFSGPKYGQPPTVPRLQVHTPCPVGSTYYDHSRCGCTPCVEDIGYDFGDQWMQGCCLPDKDVAELGIKGALINGCDAEDGACQCNIQ